MYDQIVSFKQTISKLKIVFLFQLNRPPFKIEKETNSIVTLMNPGFHHPEAKYLFILQNPILSKKKLSIYLIKMQRTHNIFPQIVYRMLPHFQVQLRRSFIFGFSFVLGPDSKLYNLKMKMPKDVSCQNAISQLQEAQTQQQTGNLAQQAIPSGKSQIQQNETNNQLKIIIYFFLIACSIVHTIIVQQQMSSQLFGQFVSNILKLITYNSILCQFSLSFLVLSKLALFFSIINESFFKLQKLGSAWLSKWCIEHFIVIFQMDLVISAFMAIISFSQNFAFLVLSCLISMVQTVYLQNYVNRKDPFYASSVFSTIFFRSFILLTYVGNTMFFFLGSQLNFYRFHCCLGTLHLIWYIKKGWNLYIHQFSSIIFLLVNAIIITINAGFAQRLFFDCPFIDGRQVCKHIIIFSILGFYFYPRKYSYLSKLECAQRSSPKNVDLLMKRLLESVQKSIQNEIEVIGLVRLHQLAGCYRYSQKKTLYEHILKSQINSNEVFAHKQTFILYYLQDLYEKSLNKDKDPQIFIDYCQFLCNQLNNPYLALRHVQTVKYHSLSIFQRLKLAKIQQYISRQCLKINEGIFDGKMEIEQIIETEKCIEGIEEMTTNYITKNINLWNSLRKRQIAPAQMRKSLKQLFKIEKQIELKWKMPSHFFPINKPWHFIYTNYLIFIKNEKVSQQKLEFFNNKQQNQKSIFVHQQIFYEESEGRDKLFNPAIMFHQDSCCLTANFMPGSLKIGRVNRRFIEITGFEQAEIIGSHVQVLMDDELAKVHQEKVDSWLQSGRISNEQQYRIPFTSFVGKDGRAIPAIKYYKAYYQIEKGVQFVCLLKANIKKVIDASNNSLASLSLQKSQLTTTLNRQKLEIQFDEAQLSSNLVEANIFFKEDTLQPYQDFPLIKSFRVRSRIFVIIVLTMAIALFGMIINDSQNLDSYCIQFFTFIAMYRYPVALVGNYMKKFLNIGNMKKVEAQIQLNTNLMLTSSAGQLIKMTLYDKNLNPPTTFYPYYNYSFLANDSKTNFDLFYTILSSISSINQPLIDHKSRQFITFNSYIKPAYDTMMNTTKYRLHETFAQTISQSHEKQYFLIGIQAIFFIIFTIIICYLTRNFVKRIKFILQISFDFHQADTQMIQKYWRNMEKHFQTLFNKLHKETNDINQFTLSKETFVGIQLQRKQSHVNLSKAPTDTTQVKELRILGMKLKVRIIIIILSVLCVTGSFEVSIMNKFQQLQAFQIDGFFFLKYFPCAPLVVVDCLQKYYSQVYPSELTFISGKWSILVIFVIDHYEFLSQQNKLLIVRIFQKFFYYIGGQILNNLQFQAIYDGLTSKSIRLLFVAARYAKGHPLLLQSFVIIRTYGLIDDCKIQINTPMLILNLFINGSV